MTRKEMITACVENQIERDVIKAENKAQHIKMRLTGQFRMSSAECKSWYDSIFQNA